MVQNQNHERKRSRASNPDAAEEKSLWEVSEVFFAAPGGWVGSYSEQVGWMMVTHLLFSPSSMILLRMILSGFALEILRNAIMYGVLELSREFPNSVDDGCLFVQRRVCRGEPHAVVLLSR